jgi:transposase InsO family protein
VFKTKVSQRPQSLPQKQFYHKVIDEMLNADIIEPIAHQDVKCCGATTLARKAHEGTGLVLEELQHRVNNQCVEAGFPSAFEYAQPREARDKSHPEPGQNKWRVCQDFAELNDVTKVPPMPQGDIRLKQQNLSGHRWLNIFDFANGFYACEIRPEDRPYICFYVEGRGYFCYKRMPFGLTGAPSTFAGMTARALGDLTGRLFELLVDDGGMAGDDFETMFQNTKTLLDRIRATGLSLSASKSKFFVTEAVFAGSRIGPDGIKPDLTKLTAVVDWKTPTDLQNLGSFLGLTGYFRSLVKGYATIAQPLTDLARSLNLPKLKGKAAYNRAMKGHSLTEIWGKEHDRAFLRLKIALTCEPVLKGPKYDGTPFIITTDGCKYGFAGMCSQKHTSVLPNGVEKTTIYPIGFVSKRTSATEEKYKPFLLETAAMKYTLDKFSDVIWGCPVELETDCQALRDSLLSDKLSTTHARWRDGILAHEITDVRHRPGRLNPVADGLSRKYVNLPLEDGDGHEWTVSEDWEARTGLENDMFKLDVVKTPLENTQSPDYVLLQKRFSDESVFLEVIDALYEMDKGDSLRKRKRAHHKAKNYMVSDGRLWRVGDISSVRAQARLECVTKQEAETLAGEIHRNGGHFHRDNIKAQMISRFTCPKLDLAITKAINECGKCKNFGPTFIHSLLEPITRRHPFELIATDTLSMPPGKGGYTKLGLFVDTYSRHLWVTKHKSATTGKTSSAGYGHICDTFVPAETLMTDGGPEFDNKELRAECEARGTTLHITPAYSPWVNGLVEGMNKKLLGVLKRMCAPNLGEDESCAADVPRNWPDHLDEAVRVINNTILPSLGYSANELLFGLVVNTRATPAEETNEEPSTSDVELQMAYVSQHHLDGYEQIVSHANKRKEMFDRKVLKTAPREVVFLLGDLVQVYRSDLDFTFSSTRKLEPKWSAPRRVVCRTKNSYQIETLEGLPINGRYSSRRLRRFYPRGETSLARIQETLGPEWRIREEADDRMVEKSDVERGLEFESTSDDDDEEEQYYDCAEEIFAEERESHGGMDVDNEANATRALLDSEGGTCSGDLGAHSGLD